MVYYEITIQPILTMQTGIQPKLTYTLNANKIQPILTYTMKWKTTILSMCNGLGVCDAAVDLTWVPCLYLKIIVARGLSISRILGK